MGGGVKIFEWNEQNCKMDENTYIKAASEKKLWAFVSDYYRLKALYEYGGIYLDTDVEIKNSFPERMFEADLVLGYMYECAISTAVIMAKPKHPFIGGLLALYEKKELVTNQPNNAVFNDYILANYPNFKLIGKYQEFDVNCFIYPRYYFEVPTLRKDGGYSVHHFMGSWHGAKSNWKSKIRAAFKWVKFYIPLLDYWYQNWLRNRLLINSDYYERYRKDLNRS